MFFEPKRIYNGPFDGDPHKPAVPWSAHARGEVPEGHYTVPIGRAEIVREGRDVTVLTYGTMVHVVRGGGAAGWASTPRSSTCAPWRRSTSTRCARRCARPAAAWWCTRPRASAATARSSSPRVQEQCFWNLEAPIQRVAGWDTPYPHAFEWEYFPGPGAHRRAPCKPGDGGGMSRYVFKLPDLGEGTVEAEIVGWRVKPGDTVAEDDVHRRGDDREGRGGSAGAGERARAVDHRRARRHGAGGRRAHRARDAGCRRRGGAGSERCRAGQRGAAPPRAPRPQRAEPRSNGNGAAPSHAAGTARRRAAAPRRHLTRHAPPCARGGRRPAPGGRQRAQRPHRAQGPGRLRRAPRPGADAAAHRAQAGAGRARPPRRVPPRKSRSSACAA